MLGILSFKLQFALGSEIVNLQLSFLDGAWSSGNGKLFEFMFEFSRLTVHFAFLIGWWLLVVA